MADQPRLTVSDDAAVEGFASIMRHLLGLAFQVTTDLFANPYEGVLTEVDSEVYTLTFRSWSHADQDWVGPLFTIDIEDPTLVLTYL